MNSKDSVFTATKETLIKCRNEESFETVWKKAEISAETVKLTIQETRFSFTEARVPRSKKPARRLQALTGESPSSTGGISQRLRSRNDILFQSRYHYTGNLITI